MTEFYIPIYINISIDDINYTENLNWDILNQEITPEKFAEILVKDEKLKKKFYSSNSISNKERYTLLYF